MILIGAVNGKCQDTTVTKHAKQECKEAKRARSDLLFFVNLLCYIYLYIKKNEKKYLHKKSLGKRSLTLLQRIHFIRFIPTSDHQKAPHLGKIAPVDVDPKSNDLKSIEIRCFQCKVKLKHLKEFEILWKPTQIASYNHLLTISVCFTCFCAYQISSSYIATVCNPSSIHSREHLRNLPNAKTYTECIRLSV